jgi:hypothetical protein
MECRVDQVLQYRAALLPPHSVATAEECAAAVDRLGFLWPFSAGTPELPGLFDALATERHGQKWDWVWPWKDRLSASRRLFYGRLLKRKPTFCSPPVLPLFYALTGNTGDLADDLDHARENQRIGEMARKVCLYLQEAGPTGTRTLLARLTDGSPAMKRALEKGLHELDTALLIVKCGTEGGNSIANVWDLFPRFLPEAVEAGAAIPTRDGALRLVRHLFTLTPAVSRRVLDGIFPWGEEHVRRAVARLEQEGELLPCRLDGKDGLISAGWQP